ncbi:MAG: glycosyltransferase family 2 protein [Gaiellales bacterium]
MTPAAAPPEVAPGTSPELELIGRTNNLWGYLADVHEPPAELAGRAAEPAQRPATADELGAELPAARSPRPALRLAQGELDTPETFAPAPPAQPEPAERPGFQIANEAVLPRRLLARTKLLRGLTWLFQAVCIGYGAALLYWIWLAKDLSAALVLHDPVFGTYSLIVTAYVLARFALAPFYRPTPDTGLRPTASIVIPAFNEEACIGQTVDACYAAEYPDGKLEVVVVDDGSSDGTWSEMLAAQRRHPTLVCVRFSHNRGKRAAMAEGIRRSTGEVCVFIDSDSVIEPDGLGAIMADFRDERVGAVVGTADVLNKTKNPVTKMQQVRYYVAFRVIKGSESIFGAVTCASGCFSAYRREASCPGGRTSGSWAARPPMATIAH